MLCGAFQMYCERDREAMATCEFFQVVLPHRKLTIEAEAVLICKGLSTQSLEILVLKFVPEIIG